MTQKEKLAQEWYNNTETPFPVSGYLAGYNECEKTIKYLLFALEKAVKDYGSEGGPWNVPSEPGTWIDMAKSAIQKAKLNK